MTAVRIRAFFKALRKAARKEGGAIGFIEEIDAIGMSRGGLSSPRRRRRRSTPAPGLAVDLGDGLGQRRHGERAADPDAVVRPAAVRDSGCAPGMVAVAQRLPAEGPVDEAGQVPTYNNILLIAATNRGDSLDPALLRPGSLRPAPVLRPADEAGARATWSTSSWLASRTRSSWTSKPSASASRTTRSATRPS